MLSLSSFSLYCWEELIIDPKPVKVGLLRGMSFLYVERHSDHWLLPTNTNPERDRGTFIRLYDNGRVETVYVFNEAPWETVEVTKPEDKGE